MMYHVYEVNYTGGQPGAGGHDDSYCMFNMRYAYSWESKEFQGKHTHNSEPTTTCNRSAQILETVQ